MALARYWPRTVFSATSCGVIGLSAFRILIFSSRMASSERLAGGSIATMHSSCSRWFCTMSRSAPVWS
ncbi:hypothetical protein D9M69_676360 [compost metagenome]